MPFDPDFTETDYDRLMETMLIEMVADGEILSSQKGRVKFIRWLTKAEYGECKLREIDGPVPTTPTVIPDVHVRGHQDTSTTAARFPASPAPETPEDERSAKFNRPLDYPDLGVI